MNKLKLVRKILDDGYFKTHLEISDDLEYIKFFENKAKDEILEEYEKLKNKIKSNDKFCIGKCQKEYISKERYIEIYCSSCDRVVGKKISKNDSDFSGDS